MSRGSAFEDERLLAVAEAVMPGQPWGGAEVRRSPSYDVLLLAGTAAVRVTRTPAAAEELPRRTELLRRLARADLPFAVPEPLSEVVSILGRSGVALTWMYGLATAERFRGRGAGLGGAAPDQLAALLGALREVDCGPPADVLGVPHEGVGGDGWAELMLGEVVPRLPWGRRREARRRIAKARDLPRSEPSLVHGNLDGTNLRWDGRGRILGVLGWDRAQLFDPALDAAWLLSQGWRPYRLGLDSEQLRRTRIWALVLGLEPVARAVLAQDSEDRVQHLVGEAVAWLERTTGWWSREALR